MSSSLPYRLGRSLGTGGYAQVFEAVPRKGVGPTVALKRGLRDTKEGIARLKREIEVQQALSHPNVMTVLDADIAEGWYTMPLALGSLLRLREDGTLAAPAEDLALDVIDQAGRGLGHAHEQGYVHRDVTPGNILAFEGDDGQLVWVVGDWGLVRRPLGQTTRRLTGDHGLGTAGFAAPETQEGDPHEGVDDRADVYSLGRVAAWLLTGTWPRQNMRLPVDGELRGFIAECTDLNPDRRPATMEAMRERLRELTAEPELGPRGEVQELLEVADSDSAAFGRAVDIAMRNAQHQELWIDEIARLPVEQVADFTRRVPDRAAEAALTMLRHMDPWGWRNYDYLNTPLEWAHEVVRVLTEEGEYGLAEDLAVDFFEQDHSWDRWRQKGITIRWLRSLEEPEGRVMRAALRRANATDYYREDMLSGRILSRSLAAEFGQ